MELSLRVFARLRLEYVGGCASRTVSGCACRTFKKNELVLHLVRV